MLTSLDACRHCRLTLREDPRDPFTFPMHAQRYNAVAGWHAWTPPTQQQILARMRARREVELAARAGRRPRVLP
ncbi:hypothetical protein [Actinomadura violacea]|uniref:Uracil-DNA glycosylase n=1 Tax=Actinomadura violacea TaxID=2819934 RepID=A0ABS3RY47_9ACTN|nr:hypothetical protein [Actinomadura violacea]MBO2461677.1 hypothetical protein [Actinomadura violacea]